MNKLDSIVIIFFVCIGCNTSLKSTLNIHPELKPYVSLYKQEAALHGKKIVINSLVAAFAHLAPEQAGVCRTGGTPTVLINVDEWQRLQALEREALMMHELAHCVQGRMHNNNYTVIDGDWVPVSIMNEVLLDASTYSLYKQQYMYELFRLKWP